MPESATAGFGLSDPVWTISLMGASQERSTVAFSSMGELMQALSDKEFRVSWEVLTSIGPEWIGGGRTIEFTLGDKVLDPACVVCVELRRAMIELFELPEVSEPGVLSGGGDITAVDAELHLEYEYSDTIPYQYGKSYSGKKVLWPRYSSHPRV